MPGVDVLNLGRSVDDTLLHVMIFLFNIFAINIPQVLMLSALALALVILLYLSKKDLWLALSCSFLLVTQLTIFLNWSSAKYGTIGNVILCVAVIIAFQRRRFNAMVRSEVRAIFETDLTRGPAITAESLNDLPPIVQKWLIRSNIIGKPPIRTLCLRQKGAMRMQENGKWLPFSAEQFINADDQAFVWNATVNSGGILPINARDKYFRCHGNMFINGMYTVPIANNSGREIDQGTLMRFLAEIIWFPTAALATYIRWDYLSETSAIATIDNGLTSVSGVFSFETNGDVKGFEGMRYRDINHYYALEKWTIAIMGYRVLGGVRIANNCEVSWQKNGKTFTWLKVEISKMQFSYGRPSDRSTIEENAKRIIEQNTSILTGLQNIIK